MNKNLKVLSSSILAGTIALGTISPNLAQAETSSTKTENTAQNSSKLSQELINVMDEYVTLNDKGMYVIDSSINIYDIVNPDEAELVLKSIKDANIANQDLLNRSSLAPGNVSTTGKSILLTVSDTQLNAEQSSNNDSVVQKAAYTSGVTKVKSYWWGYKIYLSKYVVNAAGGAAFGAGGFLTSKLKVSNPMGIAIAAGLGAAGFIGTNIPYGVELRLNKTFVSSTLRYVPTSVKYQTK